jgi:hypothetical protein
MIAGYISPFAHAPYTANKKDADHDQQNYSESDIADHGSPRSDAPERGLVSEDGNSRILERPFSDKRLPGAGRRDPSPRGKTCRASAQT